MIPAMTDPLGRHWQQPIDIRTAPMDDTHVLLYPSQFDGLVEYSTSIPSGVYPGKCWRTQLRDGSWIMRWYGEHPDPAQRDKLCTNNHRAILLMVPQEGGDA